MARPATKLDLEFLAKENYQKLLSLIETLPEGQREDSFPEGTMNRNIRDVIGHLYHWHLLFLNWYEVGMRGKKPKYLKRVILFLTLLNSTEKYGSNVKKYHLLRYSHFLKLLIIKCSNLYRNTQMKSFLPKRSIIGRVRPHSALT